ncbi:MAG: hypothetical protein P3W93_003685 [Thermus sp.]|nr:hypothetical protein [Thermus sp.]
MQTTWALKLLPGLGAICLVVAFMASRPCDPAPFWFPGLCGMGKAYGWAFLAITVFSLALARRVKD